MNRKSKLLSILLTAVFGLSLASALLWQLSHAPHAYAAGIVVNTTDDELNNDGDCSLREAIQAANLDTAVDACTPGSGADEISFSLGAGAVITLTQGQILIKNDPLTLTGPGKTLLTVDGNHAVRIFDVKAGAPFTLTGMTLQHGMTADSGGALRSDSAVVISEAAFIENAANADGGALDVAGNLTMQNSDVLSNTARGEGGGVNAFGAQTSVMNGRFQNNLAGSYGGGIYADKSLAIDGTAFISNSAQLFSGAVWAWRDAAVANATFVQNTAVNIDAGALYVRDALQLTASTFIGNAAGRNAGAILAGSDVRVENVTFTENRAANGRSAAVQVRGGAWLTNTQWIGNEAALPGGALVHVGTDGRFVNALFARNIGGAVSLEQSGDVVILHGTFVGSDQETNPALAIDTTAHITLTNSIFSSFPAAFAVAAGSVSEDYTLYHATAPAADGSVPISVGDHSYEGDPAFVDAANDDYQLSAWSEGLNTGTDAGIDADLDGDARPGGSGIDLGCDETTHVADAQLTKAALSSPAPNQPITYTLTVANVGSAMLPRLTISDQLPVQVLGPYVISSSVPITDVSGETPYAWQLHNLAPGASSVITISGVLADLLPHTQITNEAFVTSIAAETNTANNTDSAGVTAPNVGPIAVDDTATILEDAVTIFSPTANDIDGDELAITSVTPPHHGTAVLSGTQQIVYTPTLEYSGPDSFSYTVSDGVSSDEGTVAITVTAVNDAPVISQGAQITVTMSEDDAPTPFDLTLAASDAESSPLTWRVAVQPAQGEAGAAGGPAPASVIAYTPVANYFGSDQFQVQVSDGVNQTPITVNVKITAVNDPPIANADAAVALRQPSGDLKVLAVGAAGSLNVLDNDTDVENDSLTVMAVGTPDQGGAATVAGDGRLLSYTPQPTFWGTETFTYTVKETEYADTAVVSMLVTGGLDGGVGGDDVSVPDLGLDGAFDLEMQLPENVAAGDNVAVILDEAGMAPAATALHAPVPPSGFEPAGLTFFLHAYRDAQPVDGSYRFAEPVTFVVAYAEALVADIGPSEETLALYVLEAGVWMDTGTQVTARDTSLDQVTMTVDRPGEYALFRRSFLFLPLMVNNVVRAPDLVVASASVLSTGSATTAGDIEVVIRNDGNAPALDEFWVDLYVDPHTPPTAVNQTWQMMGDQGAAWGILADALPLNPGESLTLTLSSPYFVAAQSHVVWPLAAGVPFYVQVDSNNPGAPTGAVVETHEVTGAPYNNIFGPP